MSDLNDYTNQVTNAQNSGDVVFKEWPKTPRLNKEIVVTEKIDGTNACIVVPDTFQNWPVYAQSRKRIITPNSDNFGFAHWVFEHRELLAGALGPGYHYGEWYGSGIQSGYGLTNGERKFMLFNADRWTAESVAEAGLDAIGVEAATVLYRGVFDQTMIDYQVRRLRRDGSVHRPYDGKAEGVCVFHTQSRKVYKVMCYNDEVPKTLMRTLPIQILATEIEGSDYISASEGTWR